ncbi:hypothetical protein [Crateriforma conspicua]|uniref:hypothetical protein n=1 Tax=Crateriforma conspicua TaxID=2527996 RepID=UPI0011B82423|nr:hypothetical protein [Crateriforma conspicua]
MIQFPELFSNSIVILIDVPEELVRYRVHERHGIRLHRLAIGNDKTIKDLVAEHGNHEQKAAFEQLPNATSRDGLGQTRGVGECAMKDLLAQPEVQAVIRELKNELKLKMRGVLSNARMSMFAGTGGGVASAAARLILDVAVDDLLDAGLVSVNVDVHLVGALTFSGVDGERTGKNSACSILDWIQEAKGKSGLAITVFCHELPLVGCDRKTRDRLIRGQYSAMQAADVQTSFDQERSNHSTKGPFGNFYTPRMAFFRDLPEPVRASNVAQEYLRDIDDLLAASDDERMIIDIDFATRVDPMERLDALNLAESVDVAFDDEELEEWLNDLIHEAVQQSDLQGQLTLPEERYVPLNKVSVLLDGDSSAPVALRERLTFARTALKRLDREIADRDYQQEEISLLIPKILKRAVKALRFLANSGNHQNRAARKHIRAVDEYATYAIEYFAITHEVDQLEAAESEIRSFESTASSRLERIRDAMLDCLRFDEDSLGEPAVDPLPFREVFQRIFEGIEDPSDSALSLTELLSGCAGTVSEHGLSQLVDSLDMTPESIAAAVVDTIETDGADTVMQSPPWGGFERAGEVKQFIIYPAARPDFMQALVKAHRDRHDPHIVTFAPTWVPTRTVVRLELWHCRSITDLLTRDYRKWMSDANNDPLRPLYITDASGLSNLPPDIAIPSQQRKGF